jgi:hypothetical protein
MRIDVLPIQRGSCVRKSISHLWIGYNMGLTGLRLRRRFQVFLHVLLCDEFPELLHMLRYGNEFHGFLLAATKLG